ncbi:hypothetical protein MKW98_025094 [Papaver atlanticum]|uniref:Uncharacterized protein n=1 Tax=Papaver atlanticum TaxID=357466 RepID=A0AAD4S2I6_9MAGN|nr:hypothetical protein MKW98_025094 [Papaver atlanticum]
MKFLSNSVSLLVDPKFRRSCLCSLVPTASLLCLVFFFGSAFIATDNKDKITRWGMRDSIESDQSDTCKNKCMPNGSEALPSGIVAKSSNLEMRPLWGIPKKIKEKSLLAVAVGIKQKENINKMVKKFPTRDFVIMLFHYDGFVDEWNDLEWSERAIHVSAVNQTKWWFAKRFLHPDIVAEYSYIFLWDEDLGVENFHPGRYISIVKEEGLEISQPALDPAKSEVHHQITARGRRSKVHRRIYKTSGGNKCDGSSTDPPCTGFVEMMAPVFSRAAWRCTWYMIQNDLIHAWGVDIQLGYCAQGDKTKNIGVVDAEYIVHQGLPTLGIVDEVKSNFNQPTQPKDTSNSGASVVPIVHPYDDRMNVRRQSYIELEIFRTRWKRAVENDKCWHYPTQQPSNQTGSIRK